MQQGNHHLHSGGSMGGSGSVLPSAPPMDSINPVPGYEGSSFNHHFVPPPAGYYDPGSIAPPENRPEIEYVQELKLEGRLQSVFLGGKDCYSLPVLTEEGIRDALGNFVSEHCCYGDAPVHEMRIFAFEPACAFHYVLETFSEQRETKWAFRPYKGEFLDTGMNGPAPLPWNMRIEDRGESFKDRVVKVQVPHTESVSQCHVCHSTGVKRCQPCLGKGREECKWAGVHSESSECSTCRDTGFQECGVCQGSGQKRCSTCSGSGQLTCYIELTVTFKNHTDEFLGGGAPNSESLPKKLKRAEGMEVFRESGFKVFPVPSFPDHGVLTASRDILRRHEGFYSAEKVHAQRHKIRAIPITRVYSQYKEVQKKFYVYGLENKVEFQDYYSKWGRCCVLL